MGRGYVDKSWTTGQDGVSFMQKPRHSPCLVVKFSPLPLADKVVTPALPVSEDMFPLWLQSGKPPYLRKTMAFLSTWLHHVSGELFVSVSSASRLVALLV